MASQKLRCLILLILLIERNPERPLTFLTAVIDTYILNTEVDRMGRINLTMRPEDMTADLEKLTRPERRERSDRPERRDDRRGGRHDDRRERSEKKDDNE